MSTILPGYEITIITKNDITDSQLKGVLEKVEKTVKDYKGNVVNTEDWGKRKLAFPLRKETRAQYSYFAFTGTPGVISEVERHLRISEHVLRFMSVNIAEEFNEAEYTERHVSPVKPRKVDENAQEYASKERRPRRFQRDRD